MRAGQVFQLTHLFPRKLAVLSFDNGSNDECLSGTTLELYSDRALVLNAGAQDLSAVRDSSAS